LLDALINNYCY